ncbi:hypothetical protein KEM52_000916, partial [Ascosphaera acerosa]
PSRFGALFAKQRQQKRDEEAAHALGLSGSGSVGAGSLGGGRSPGGVTANPLLSRSGLAGLGGSIGESSPLAASTTSSLSHGFGLASPGNGTALDPLGTLSSRRAGSGTGGNVGRPPAVSAITEGLDSISLSLRPQQSPHHASRGGAPTKLDRARTSSPRSTTATIDEGDEKEEEEQHENETDLVFSMEEDSHKDGQGAAGDETAATVTVTGNAAGSGSGGGLTRYNALYHACSFPINRSIDV